MRALVHRGPHAIGIEERPVPAPGPGELLLAPRLVGVCVSDRHAFEGLMYGPPWAAGLVPGHEFAATVQAAGAGVEGWAPGTRVAVDPRLSCGACDACRAGLQTLCERGSRWIGVHGAGDGAFAELCVAPAANCHPLPAAVPDAIGAPVEPLASVTRSLRRAEVRAGDSVVVLGAEDYALLLVQLLAGAGVGAVVVLDPSSARREAALASGATQALDPTAAGARRAAHAALGGGADVAFVSMEDYLPAADAYLRLAFGLCRIQGSVMVLRAYGAGPYAAIEPHVPYMKELTIRHAGAFYGDEPARGGAARGDWQLALAALAAGRVGPIPGTQVVDFADLRTDADVAELFGRVGHVPKVLVRVGATASP